MFYDTKDLDDGEIFLRLVTTSEGKKDKGWLPGYYFDICSKKGIKLGNCDLRIGHNNKTYIGGNIGYNVDKEHRGNNYAAKACRLLFKLARKHDLGYLYITCDPDNIASYKTCESLGGEFIEIRDIPKTNEMYALDKLEVKIYKFEL